MSGTPALAYKILTAEQKERLCTDGTFAGAPVDLADGYIHLSTAQQLAGTLDKHFESQTGLYLAAVDLAACSDILRWEEARGGQLFPHLYGTLEISAVIAIAPVSRSADGSVTLPA